MFNLQGSELIIILLLALVILGPEKLPDAMRKAGQFYAELKKMSSGFQSEFKSVVEEPLNELKNTANTLRDSADFTKFQAGEREEKPKSAEMVAAPDPDAVPTDDLPFTPEAAAAAASAVAGAEIVESDVFESESVDTAVDVVRDSSTVPPPPEPFSSSQQLSSSPPPRPEPTEPTDAEAAPTTPAPTASPATGDLVPAPAVESAPKSAPKPFSSSQQLSTSPAPRPEPAEPEPAPAPGADGADDAAPSAPDDKAQEQSE